MAQPGKGRTPPEAGRSSGRRPAANAKDPAVTPKDRLGSVRGEAGLANLLARRGEERAQLVRQLQRDYGNQRVQRMLVRLAEQEPGDSNQVSPDVTSRIAAQQGSGRPLEGHTRVQMEGAFGHDFSDVRVHTGAEASDLNEKVQAKAFTTGKDIYFHGSNYSPGSASGKELLAHELTHVVQQGGASASASGPARVTSPNDASEVEAAEVAKSLVRGGELARQPEEEELQMASAPEEEEELQMARAPEEEELQMARAGEEDELQMARQPVPMAVGGALVQRHPEGAELANKDAQLTEIKQKENAAPEKTRAANVAEQEKFSAGLQGKAFVKAQALSPGAMSLAAAQKILQGSYGDFKKIVPGSIVILADQPACSAKYDEVCIRDGVLHNGNPWQAGDCARDDAAAGVTTEGFAWKGVVYVNGKTTLVTATVHEMLHLNAEPNFRATAGETFNEGVTETLARKALSDAGIPVPGTTAYPAQVALTKKLIDFVGADVVYQAYFGDVQGLVTAFTTKAAATWATLKTAAEALDTGAVDTALTPKAP